MIVKVIWEIVCFYWVTDKETFHKNFLKYL